MEPTRSHLPLLLALALLTLFLRLNGLAEPSLWLDEILHLQKAEAARGEGWSAWLTGLSADRENGALYYAGQVLGLTYFDGEFAVRLAPALCGVATVGVVFLIGLSLTACPWRALVPAAFLAVSPLHVYYSREGRPYAAVMLVAALLLYLALTPKRRFTTPAVYATCLAAALLGAVSSPLLVACAGLGALHWLVERRHGHFVVAASSALLLGLLLFPTAEKLGEAIGTGKRAPTLKITEPLSPQALDRLLASLTTSGLDRSSATTLSWIFLGLALVGAVGLLRRDLRRGFWVVGLAVLPVVGWLMVLVLFKHWYNVRYTSSGLPAFLVLVAFGLLDVGNLLAAVVQRLPKHLARLPDLATAVALVLLLLPLWRASRVEPWQKPDWRGVATTLDRLAVPGEPVIARGAWAERCIRYYLNDRGSSLEVLFANNDVPTAEALTQEHPRAWVLAAGYWRTPDFEAWMKGLDPVLSRRLGNIQLFFSPNFRALVSETSRFPGLAEELATLGEPTHRQDFGLAEMLLGEGWSYSERGDGRTFRWAVGERAEMAIGATPGPGAKTLRLRLRPYPWAEGPPQEVTVGLNGRPWATVTLEAEWKVVELPPSTAVRGGNLLTFDFAWSRSPKSLGRGSDGRPLAVAFDFVEVADANTTLGASETL